MNLKSIAFTALLMGGFALPSQAQEVVGRALVEGKTVELMADRTWRYEGEISGLVAPSVSGAGTNCSAIHAAVTFCADPNLWTASTPPTPEIVAAYSHDDRHYGQFVVETFGSADGVNPELMRDIVVQNAAGATGQRTDEIVILDVAPTTIGGLPAETVVYQVEFDGLKVVFSNTILIQPSLTMQAITYAIGAEFTEKHQGLHQTLVENTSLN
ncbi:hypothetical protein IV417_05705 [Alphaproteobacteria bacterium KMM 3653]|uniref:Uncharacterized protein n=1 Tax=Harenicola maris TaxID=2841044 RepID=A0AAP2CQT8_9RHOB|nr:hypothetical protein [Harenicola maris]